MRRVTLCFDDFLAKILYRLSVYFRIRENSVTLYDSLTDSQRAEKDFQRETEQALSFDKIFDVKLRNKVVLDIGSACGGYIYHTLKCGARLAYGIELSKERCDASLMNLVRFCDNNNYKIFHADARYMNMITSNSIDIIVSNATIEHIIGLDLVLKEIYRILKVGGVAYLFTGGTWYTYGASHLKRYIPFPWVHLVLTDRIILKTLKMQLEKGHRPEFAMKNIIDLYENLGKLSIRKLRCYIRSSKLQLIRFENVSNKKLKKPLLKLPILNEVFAGGIRVVLKKAE